MSTDVDALIENTVDTLETLHAAKAALAEIRGTGTRRFATAVVDGRGRLVDLRLSGSLRTKHHTEVEAVIVKACAAARADAADQRRAILAALRDAVTPQ